MLQHLTLSTLRQVIDACASAEAVESRANQHKPICTDFSQFPEPEPEAPETAAYRELFFSLPYAQLVELVALERVGAERTPRSQLRPALARWLDCSRRHDDHMPEYLLSKGNLHSDLEWALSLLTRDDLDA